MSLPKAEALIARFRTLFPDREFVVRSAGQVRVIRVSARNQKIGVGVAAGVLAAWCASVGSLALSQTAVGEAQASLAQRAAQVAHAERTLRAHRAALNARAADLARRQTFIEQVVDAHIGELPGDDATAAQTPTAPLTKLSAATLDQVEAGQNALVARLTRYADARSKTASEAMRKLGLNPRAMAASAREAEGGPLVTLTTAANGSVDPRFRRMGQSLARMDALENGLASLPQVSPAHVAYVSSSYGYRADPFTGGAAFHAGLDFPGPMGSPIYAAAKGKVTFVGQRSGYGNCIEVTHGNGLMTRYGHLSGFRTRVGQDVDAGALIGAMGSTGRSTGSHLHFEVRVHDRPVNPRTFLEAARKAQLQTPDYNKESR